MSDVQDRLARLRKAGRLQRRKRTPGTPPSLPPASLPATSTATNLNDLADLPGMEVVETSAGAFLLRTIRYELSHEQGNVSIGALLELPVGLAAQVEKQSEMAGFDFHKTIFIDTETSGLAGGAGTIVFLTGVGTFEDDQYVVRQYFARNPAEESVYLPHLAAQMQQARGWVSFNGKSFDLPLLRSRFILAGIMPPTAQPHLDLLHPARRLWRERLGACNFGKLETQILAHQRSGQDVPSWIIPNLWFRFAKGENNVDDMAAVLYHNQEDIASMAPLAHALLATFAGVIEPHPRDVLSLAKAYTRLGDYGRAETAFRQALDGPLSAEQRFEAMSRLAALLKRQGRRKQAAIWWEAQIELAPTRSVAPYIELAKYHEWETGDLAAARLWTEKALAAAQTWCADYHRSQ
ncbi:MAG TPA: hypothetical protein G4N94_12665, partial [Caldilineae bacterium]|nr:hypothetical protein [Caldilineae bacterium]